VNQIRQAIRGGLAAMPDRGLQKNASLLAISRDAIAPRVQIRQLDFRGDASLSNRVPQQLRGAGRIAAAPIGTARKQLLSLVEFGLRGIQIGSAGQSILASFCTAQSFAFARGAGSCFIFMTHSRRTVRFGSGCARSAAALWNSFRLYGRQACSACCRSRSSGGCAARRR
jgi:hypothetical protein